MALLIFHRYILVPMGVLILSLPTLAVRLPHHEHLRRAVDRLALGDSWHMPANHTFRLTVDRPDKALFNIAVKAMTHVTVTVMQNDAAATTTESAVAETGLDGFARVGVKCFPDTPLVAATTMPMAPGSTHPGWQISGHKPPSMLWNFTDKCDSGALLTEDCRVTMNCDASMGLYPTCEAGECKCLAKPCFRASTCFPLRQCRADYEEHFCSLDQASPTQATTPLGVCGCRPRITDCLFKGGNPHHYCGTDFNCTEPYFSLYPQFPQCNTGDAKYPRGRCQCGHFNCVKAGTDRDFEVCKDLISCERSQVGRRPYCNVKWGSENRGKEDGYCTCVL